MKLELFVQVLETVGSELLIYKSQLESVIFALLKLNGKKPYTFASNLLQRLLNSLAYIYPLENRISEADFDDINYLSMKVKLVFSLIRI